jgi:VWFA-related protein
MAPMTRKTVAAVGAFALAGVWIAAPAAQSGSGAAPRSPQSITSGATAILVDVVVRDKRGRPIIDLSATDFEIAEDGVPQTLDTFTRVARGAIGVGVAWKTPDRVIGPTGTAGPGLAAEPSTETVTTALVFDHLSADALRLAQRATLGYVPATGESSVRVGVFETGPGFRVVQPYTSDLTQVRRAVDRVLPSGTSAEELRAERGDELTTRRRELRGETESAVAGVVAGSGAVLARNAAELGRRETELRLIQTEINMMRASTRFA